MKTALGSYTFTLKRDAAGAPLYEVRLFNGLIVPASWPDEGSALAGAETEERRTLSRAYRLGEDNPERNPEFFGLRSALEKAEFNRGSMAQVKRDDRRCFDRD